MYTLEGRDVVRIVGEEGRTAVMVAEEVLSLLPVEGLTAKRGSKPKFQQCCTHFFFAQSCSAYVIALFLLLNPEFR